MQKVIERILNLLAFLLTVERPVTAEEVRHTVAGYDAENDEAYRRMFERDKDLLRQLGIPIELRPTDAWEVEYGYVISKDYALADPGLTDEERVALWLAAQAVRIGGSPGGATGLFKLGGAPMVGAGEPLAADLGQSVDELAIAFTCVAERKALRYRYRDKDRTVYPYGLVHRRGHWYLVAPEADDTSVVKAFRMDKMTGLAPHGAEQAFVRPSGFRAADAIPAAQWEAGADDLSATVRFDESVAWWAERQLPSSTGIERHDEGGFTATMTVANIEAFIGWMLGFDDSAEILEPAVLRDKLVDRVRGVA